ncbi:protein AMBP [Hyperolius riggenbachi]|uniref:protein AMBP n=1 Tax=Hyperolius riggenbachi TaxID=752182 RepID=UPI0035A27D6B
MEMYLLLVPFLVAVATGSSDPAAITTQENFDINRMYGKWYDVAMGSDCPYMKRHKKSFDMGVMQLSEGETDGDMKVVITRMRRGTCMEVSDAYQKTDIPGKFQHTSKRFLAQVESYVVFTNYFEYATVLMRKSKDDKVTTTVKLYGRTPELRADLIEDFRQFAMEQGITEDSIFMFQNKGECSPGDIEVIPRRTERSADKAEEEGSGGMENNPFSINRAASCHLPPNPGPCLGSNDRYFYNSSSMACQMFKYGGCLGNLNNYNTERECLQTCRTEAACRLPITTGPCKGAQSRWAFDSDQGKCVSFQYGGCKGNGNHFYTEKECKEYCGVPTNDEEEFL